jgi:two-component system, chemotaxis family, CheB/CheR fusion protein
VATETGQDTEALKSLLDFLRDARGFDFSGYKRATLSRRIGKRMDAVGVESYDQYQEYLEVNPGEFTELFNTILINVTSFFRDEAAWDYVASTVVPEILAGKRDSEPVRVWSAGCASGEEAYTLVMVLAEAMGEEAFKRRAKVYATDIDEDALTTARHSSYPAEALESVPEELRAKYFEPNSIGFQARPDLRRCVIFGRNDLIQDAPISRIDLLLSRNVLMYFTAEAQARILARFNFALDPDGYLFVGKSEMLLSHNDLFEPVDVKARVFRKADGSSHLRERLAAAGVRGTVAARGTASRHAELVTGAAAVLPVAVVTVDADGNLASVNELARALFRLGSPDLGRPFQDLEVSYRPADIRTALDRARAERRQIALGRFPWPPGAGDEATMLDIKVTPVAGDGADDLLGAVITFEDVTAIARLSDDYDRSRHELEGAYEELESTVEELETTNEELQSTNEELETTNEELQSTNEELETTNEELQSTNEELETMNEELQSTNDELEAMNEEQNERARELDRVNMFLEAILGSLGVGVIVVNSDQRIEVWNAQSFDLWGLRANEVEGRSFMALDIGLAVDRLADPLRQTLAGREDGAAAVLDAVNRRGKSFRCVVRILPIKSADGDTSGAVILMGDADSSNPLHELESAS